MLEKVAVSEGLSVSEMYHARGVNEVGGGENF